jgi:protein-tyrosine-phosphatase
MAEAIMNKVIAEEGLSSKFQVDSAGTSSNHVGENPDERTLIICRQNQVPIYHKARQISEQDFAYFDLLIAMDESNFLHLNKLADQRRLRSDHIHMMREFDKHMDTINVADPWFGDLSGFETCYATLKDSCEAWFIELKKRV